MPQFLLSVREHGAFSLGERTQITGKIEFCRGFMKQSTGACFISRSHRADPRRKNRGPRQWSLEPRGAAHSEPPSAPEGTGERGERRVAGGRGGGGQAGRKCLGSPGSAPQQGNGYGRSRSPIRAHTGEVQTKCPPHIGKSGQRLTQGA